MNSPSETEKPPQRLGVKSAVLALALQNGTL
jgi:hypothetical protein